MNNYLFRFTCMFTNFFAYISFCISDFCFAIPDLHSKEYPWSFFSVNLSGIPLRKTVFHSHFCKLLLLSAQFQVENYFLSESWKYYFSLLASIVAVGKFTVSLVIVPWWVLVSAFFSMGTFKTTLFSKICSPTML